MILYGNDRVIIRCSVPDVFRENLQNDPAADIDSFDRYLVFGIPGGFERELVPALPERKGRQEIPEVLYSFDGNGAENAYSVMKEGIRLPDGTNDGKGTLL